MAQNVTFPATLTNPAWLDKGDNAWFVWPSDMWNITFNNKQATYLRLTRRVAECSGFGRSLRWVSFFIDMTKTMT